MRNEKEVIRNLCRIEPRSLGLGLLVGFCLALMTYISMSDRYVTPFLAVESRYGVPASPRVEQNMNSRQLDAGPRNVAEDDRPSSDGLDPEPALFKKNDAIEVQRNSSSIIQDASSRRQDEIGAQQLEGGNIKKDQHEKDDDNRVPDKNSFTTSEPTGKPDIINLKQLGERRESVKPQKDSVCDFSNGRSDICKVDGDVRIYGRSSTVVAVTSNQMGDPELNEPRRIKPYVRKFDRTIMQKIREVTIKLSNGNDAPACNVKNNFPAIVFAVGGYTGSFYHDFSDALVPLFTTAHQFNGEVQLLIADTDLWWVHKYRHILQKISRYEVIDFDNDRQVRCYTRAIVGLHSHEDIYIDPARDPDGYTIADFTKLVRRAYSLERESPIKLGGHPERKPRLVIIDRHLTRRLVNVKEVVKMAKGLGFEVVIAEAKFETDVNEFAHIIHSGDVMLGVHGAGLTNIIFLPPKAVFIQIVPWGGLEKMARYDYGDPAKNMKLQYLEYSISAEESTLIDLYPRDDPVFTDPESLHKRGWVSLGKVFLVEQNVKLDLGRFRPVLQKALELLH